MRMSFSKHLLGLTLLAALAFLQTACPARGTCGNKKLESGESCDDGNQVAGDGCSAQCKVEGSGACGNGVVEAPEACDDGNLNAGDGCELDCTVTPTTGVCGNGSKEASESCDDGNQVAGDGCENDCTPTGVTTTECPGANASPPASGTCDITPGTGKYLLFQGIVLGPETVFKGGQVLVDDKGVIACAACDCTSDANAAAATKVTCPRGVISPGLINSHDHLSFQGAPAAGSDERYEHRHDWRVGGASHDGHTKVSSGGTASSAMIRWGELRQVMSGTTSIVGATNGQLGMLRNLDTSTNQEGLGEGAKGVSSDTFPLGDNAGAELATGCAYPSVATPSEIPGDSAYLPHIAEGIEASARNEFVCLSSTGNGAQDILTSRVAIVHGIGLKAGDVALVAGRSTGLIWSPRSNVSLYGNTAAIPLYSRLGVKVALGTDWTISGSMNMLRELKCADSLNQSRFDKALSDFGLWKTVTSNAADLTQTAEKIGRLQAGKVADIAIFKAASADVTYRAVIDAKPQDVVMTMRGGRVLFGDVSLVNALAMDCDALDVCGAMKSACVQKEFAQNLAALTAANAATYPLFFCGEPTNEPSCLTERAARNVKNMSTTYGTMASSGDTDADGIPNAMDNCPTVFNPVRPMDNGKQADGDADGQGDVCDVCPLTAGSTMCAAANPNDADGDGVTNASDNCPNDANPAQTDSDGDMKGDVCDSCAAPNPGMTACPVSIYALKTPGSALVGQHVSVGNVIVTAAGPTGFFVQVHPSDPGYTGADYSGIFVYKPGHDAVAGDRVTISDGVVVDFYGQLEFNNPTMSTNPDGGLAISSGNALPSAVPVSAAGAADGGAMGQKYEGVLVSLTNVAVTSVTPPLGPSDKAPSNEFVVDNALRVNDFFYLTSPFPAVGETINALTGVLQWRNGAYKVEPRSASDVIRGPAVLSAFEPAQIFVRAGQTNTGLPSALTVTISHAEMTAVTVNVTPSSPDITIANGGAIVIPAGQTSATVTLTGNTRAQSVVLTASYNGLTKTVQARVIDGTDVPTLVSLTPAMAAAVPGGKAALKVEVDLPVAADTAVALAIVPASGVGTVPSTVTILQDKTAATFDFTADAMANGMATVTATLGGGTPVSTLVRVTLATTNHVVISEVGPKGPAGASDEFVELYNPTGASVDIGGWKLQYKSAAGTTYTDKGIIPVNSIILPGKYFLIAGPSYSGAVAPDFKTSSDLALAGDSGHVRLGNTSVTAGKTDSNSVDVLGYGPGADSSEGGNKTPALASGNNATSFERKALPTSTAMSMSAGGSDELKGNGVDTDKNGEDFVMRTTRDPQNASSAQEP